MMGVLGAKAELNLDEDWGAFIYAAILEPYQVHCPTPKPNHPTTYATNSPEHQ
jgi:hypothetical protein